MLLFWIETHDINCLWQRMEEAELQLRTLQTACRDLIVRTAGGVAAAGAIPADKSSWDIASRISMTRYLFPALLSSFMRFTEFP